MVFALGQRVDVIATYIVEASYQKGTYGIKILRKPGFQYFRYLEQNFVLNLSNN